jgi:hypothetical protein
VPECKNRCFLYCTALPTLCFICSLPASGLYLSFCIPDRGALGVESLSKQEQTQISLAENQGLWVALSLTLVLLELCKEFGLSMALDIQKLRYIVIQDLPGNIQQRLQSAIFSLRGCRTWLPSCADTSRRSTTRRIAWTATSPTSYSQRPSTTTSSYP